MERASRQCLRARISICHNKIRSSQAIFDGSKQRLSSLVTDDILSTLSQFLKQRSRSVHTTIEARHAKKLSNLSKEKETHHSTSVNKNNWVVNLSKKPLSSAERSILEKGPKFAPTPSKIPVKYIVCEIEAGIVHLPDDTKDSIQTTTASILHRARLPPHSNTTKSERKALKTLKEDCSRIIMKADKGNCFVVLDRTDYDEKMDTLLGDRSTYQLVQKSPFSKVERGLNRSLLDLKKKNKINESTYRRLRSTDAAPPAIRGSIKHHKSGCPLRPIVSCIGSALYKTHRSFSRTF